MWAGGSWWGEVTTGTGVGVLIGFQLCQCSLPVAGQSG